MAHLSSTTLRVPSWSAKGEVVEGEGDRLGLYIDMKEGQNRHARFFYNEEEVLARLELRPDSPEKPLYLSLLMATEQKMQLKFFGSTFPSNYKALPGTLKQ